MRLAPVVLAVILGLLGMHALVVANGAHSMSTPSQAVLASPDTASPMVGSPTVTIPMPSAVVAGADGVAPADGDDPPAPQGDHSAGHQMLHLCLAVLAALIVLLTALLPAVLRGLPGSPGGSNAGRTRSAPRRRPPPTAVRLAQLCVMRN